MADDWAAPKADLLDESTAEMRAARMVGPMVATRAAHSVDLKVWYSVDSSVSLRAASWVAHWAAQKAVMRDYARAEKKVALWGGMWVEHWVVRLVEC